MKGRAIVLLPILFLLQTSVLTGCWNYREVEKLTIVAGVAIDKGTKHKYQLTVETVEIAAGPDVKPKSQLITIEGDTIFDAVRNEISLAGKKLYWSHTKVVILSKAVAKEGILRVVDWFSRDSETRADVLLLVSKEKKAKDIFKGGSISDPITSFELAEMVKNEKSLSKAPLKELWEFAKELEVSGIVATLPTVNLKSNNGKRTPQILGSAIFSKDKLIGYLNSEETKYMLFVQNEIKGGLLNTKGISSMYRAPISLEIFRSITKKKPIVNSEKIKFKIDIDTTVGLDEIGGDIDLFQEKNLKRLEQYSEMKLKARVENVINHVQSTYGVDVFGFGEQLSEDKPKIWRKIKSHWENDKFKELEVSVNTKVHIKGSGMLSKPIELGD